ncbi:MAG: glycosyltransferase [Candidatus Campbellbacteria bacterium]|nr:glycosyltransferase [Candidatus Campbellbacteria bacterium]
MKKFWDKNLYRILFLIQIILAVDILLFTFILLSSSEIITILSYLTIGVFFVGSFLYLRRVYFMNDYKSKLKKQVYSMRDIISVSAMKGRDIPKIAVFVPARNEGRVIENTIRRLTELDYPKDAYKIYVIVDEREKYDDVDRTTKEVAKETILDLQKNYPAGFVNCVEVPEWYSGTFGDFTKTYAHSTKGRALNYCLEYIRYTGDDEDIEMIGILDADGRLDVDSLKEIAFLRMMKNSKILQGIVLGVSNMKNLNIVGIGAFIEGVVHHLSFMTHRLMRKNKKLLFLAGTNYFFEKDLLFHVGGWDAGSLVEDAELGLRTYILTGHTAEWYSCPEIEQSPSNYATYFKQRERWARGHFQLIPYVVESELPWYRKIHLTLKIYSNAYSSIWHLGMPVIGWFLMVVGAYGALSIGFQFVMLYLLFASITIFDFYGYTYRMFREYIEPYNDKKMSRGYLLKMSVILYLYTPVHFVVQAIPRFYAPFKYYRSPDTPQLWYKTERTVEESEKEVYVSSVNVKEVVQPSLA